MNRDEILSMPAGRELDALVAEKVMGLKLDKHRKGSVIEGNMSSGISRYSTDISMAWKVVEELRRKGWHLRLNIGINATHVTFIKGNSGKWEYVMSNSTPLAICQAALIAIKEVLATDENETRPDTRSTNETTSS